jgi:hypothetical protein
MYEMMMGNLPFINANEICKNVVQYPTNPSSNATSILQGVSTIFYFNYAQVVVVGFMTLYTNDKTWYSFPYRNVKLLPFDLH